MQKRTNVSLRSNRRAGSKSHAPQRAALTMKRLMRGSNRSLSGRRRRLLGSLYRIIEPGFDNRPRQDNQRIIIIPVMTAKKKMINLRCHSNCLNCWSVMCAILRVVGPCIVGIGPFRMTYGILSHN